MSQFAYETRVAVQPFTRQSEGSEVVIGLPKSLQFLALPAEAVEVLDDLASGKTVGQAQDLYRERYGEIPDLAGLLVALEERGFVRSSDSSAADPERSAVSPQRFHMESFPQPLARLLFCRPILALYGVLIASALAMIANDPSLIPGREAFVFKENMSLANLGIVAVMLLTLAIHELAHFVAACARGVPSRFGLGNRLWELVAETDLTGLWAVPRRQRYLPLLAGMIADAVLASVLVGVLFARKRAWLAWSWPSLQIVQAILLVLLLRLLWQLCLHVRTDLYYVVTNLFGCKNLLGDTEVALRNWASRFISFFRYSDQSNLQAHERQVIRGYAVVWILGRALAAFVLFFIRIPVLVSYLALSLPLIAFRQPATPYRYVDALLMTVFILLMNGLGFFLWLRDLVKKGE